MAQFDTLTAGYLTEADISYPPPTAVYELPSFMDSEHGYLPVTYTAMSGIKNRAGWGEGMTCPHFHYHAVLFATVDGGRTWRADRMLFSNPEGGDPSLFSSTVLSGVKDSSWILANYSFGTVPSFTTLSPGAKVDASNDGNGVFWPLTDPLPFQFEFATPSEGWMTRNNQLLSTTNGGVTWNPISPKVDQPTASETVH